MDRLDPTRQEILRLEEEALARWCRGDPSGFLERSAPDVVYFDPFLPARLDGLAALRGYYEGLRGKVSAASWELVSPLVQVVDRAAILTFQFVSRGPGGEVHRWNCTEGYRKDPEGWRIVATHWAFAAPAA